MGDVVLEVNGYPMGGENDVEKLQQLLEAEPPLCLKLAARSSQGYEAWNYPGVGEVRRDRWTVSSRRKIEGAREEGYRVKQCEAGTLGL